jgi:mono/diheme cytochrome c family protein
MNDKETASVLNYIRNAWGNHAPEVMELDVNQARERP